ncbi:MAG: allophanate hydrolase subunit 1 [Actinomycetota bacterium]|nr:allophanate hydrolase subunit 1 [Actinomycetota bacterium]
MLPYGPRAVLAEFDSLAEVMTHSDGWRSAALIGVVDIVPAARTVLVVHDGSLDPSVLGQITMPTASPTRRPLVTVNVQYDGDDLDEVASRCDLTVAEVVALHTGTEYTVAFCGFMPGFAYLVGLPSVLHLPRRATPRTRVPEGSVAIAAEFTGVYPRESPGGWHLLGRTDAPLWDDLRTPPALLPPGARVRFRER